MLKIIKIIEKSTSLELNKDDKNEKIEYEINNKMYIN